MKRHPLLCTAIALAMSACAPAPVPSDVAAIATQTPSTIASTLAPSASPTRTKPPTTRFGVTAEFREHCGSIGGCAAYVALIPAGETQADETKLGGPDTDGPALPSLIGQGAYTVRFRLAAVSDDRQVGAPPDQATVARCEVAIEVDGQSAVDITVAFERDSCEVVATYTVAILN